MSDMRLTGPIPALPERSAPTMGLILALACGGTLAFVFLTDGSLPLTGLALGALFAAVLVLRNPMLGFAGFLVMIIANVSDNLIAYMGLPSVAKLAAPALAVVLLYRWVVAGERPFVHVGGLVLMGGFILIKLFSVLIAADWSVSFDLVVEFLKETILAFLALAFIARPRGFDVLTWTVLATAGGLCALGALKLLVAGLNDPYYLYNPSFGFVQFSYTDPRFSGSIGDPNFFAAILVFMLPMALQASLNVGMPLRKIGCILILGMILVGILLTKSRGGMLAAAVSVLVLLPFLQRRQIYAIVAFGVVSVAVAASFLSDEIIARLFSIVQTAQTGGAVDESVEGRLASWSVARQLFYDHPLFGVGLGNFKTYYQDTALNLGLIFRGEGRSAHSLYLEILSETGLLGFGWFLLIVGFALLGVLRATLLARRADQLALAAQYAAFGAGIIGYLAATAFLHAAFLRFLWIVLVTGIALPCIARMEIARRIPSARV